MKAPSEPVRRGLEVTSAEDRQLSLEYASRVSERGLRSLGHLAKVSRRDAFKRYTAQIGFAHPAKKAGAQEHLRRLGVDTAASQGADKWVV